jgi:hypothetical protein
MSDDQRTYPRYRTFAGLFLVAAAVGFGGTCIGPTGGQSFNVPDVSRPAELDLDAQTDEAVTGAGVWVTGEIDGQADLYVGNAFPVRISGRVEQSFYLSFSQPDHFVRYYPYGVTNGYLIVHYRFNDSKD